MWMEILLWRVNSESPLANVGHSAVCLNLPLGGITASEPDFRGLPSGIAVGKQDQHSCNGPCA